MSLIKQPSSASYNGLYARKTNVISSSYLSDIKPFAIVQIMNYWDHFIVQLMIWIAFVKLTTSMRTTLFYGIHRIFRMCPKPEMIWSYANPIVTTMAYAQTIFDRAIMNFPRYPMCRFRFSSDVKIPVTAFGYSGSPDPTSFSFFDVFEESFVGRFCNILSHGKLILSCVIPRMAITIAGVLFILPFLHLPVCAEGPLFKHKDGFVDREFNNAYNDIRKVLKGSVDISTATVSSMTVTSLYVSSISIPSLTAWTAYTPTVSDTTSVNLRSGFWRRIGDSMELRVGVEWNGGGAGATFTVALPSGYTMDTAKLPANTILSLGTGQWYDASASRKIVAVRYNSTTTVAFDVSAGTSLLNGTDFADQDDLTFQILIPITGWSF